MNGVFFLLKWVSRFLADTYSSFVLYNCQHKLTSSQAFCTIIGSQKNKNKKLVHFILEKLNFQSFLNDFFPHSCFPKFPICSPRVFPIAPYLYPLEFVCSKFFPSQLYRWAKGEALHLHIETLMLGSFPSFNIYIYIYILVMGKSK